MANISLNTTYTKAIAASNQAFVGGAAGGGSSTAFLRNRIINGNALIDQRGPQIITTDSTAYGPDRFAAVIATGAGAPCYTIQRRALSNNEVAAGACQLFVNSNVTFGAGGAVGLRTAIEGIYIPDLYWGTAAAATVSVSFWARSSVVGTHSLALQNAVSNMSYIVPFSISQAGTWTLVSTSVAGPTTGTWDTGSNAGILVSIDRFGTGLSNATTGSWLSGNFTCSASYPAALWTTAGNYVEITNLQIEKGSSASAFEQRPQPFELGLCRRYYETSFPYDVDPANNTPLTAPGNAMYLQGQYGASMIYFTVPKRAIPTMTFYNPWNSNGVAYAPDVQKQSSTFTAQSPNHTGFSVGSTDANIQNQLVLFNWAANADF